MTFPAEDDFHRLLDSLTLCVLLHDAQTKAIVWANRAACEALGFTVDELRPLKAHDMTRPEPKYARANAIAAMDRSETQGPQVYEWCYRSRRGEDMLSEAIATHVKLGARAVVMVQFRDISAEEAMRRKLRHFETRLREFMQDLGEGVAVLDAGDVIQYVSESGKRLLTPDAPMQSDAILDYLDPADHARLQSQLRAAPAHRPSTPQRYRMRDGERWLRITCRHLQGADDLAGILIHFRDVTDVVRIEAARAAEAKMLEYAGRYNAMGEMAIAIAHELSQPLAAIRNFIEGAIQRLAKPDRMEGVVWGLQAADRQAEHAAEIIASVRGYVARREPNVGVAELGSIIHDVTYFVELRARDAGIAVTVEPFDEALPVDCERVLIGQVILNLAFNAIDALIATPADTRMLTIGAFREGSEAVVRVRDNGPGVPDGVHGRLFDGFSSSKPSGNGIGLSLCNNIVTRHGGRIRAFLAEGGGLECRFWLPLHRDDGNRQD
ncbi:PAS domain-containing sensor histidine kinase [Burkholderia gladioli]|uniref:PAS domain-containing sensor histidine kinase n=1 Tax=Burkholderia gladioli TaxID=28095 RepID=UPI001C5F0761|nr:HAMP domain-containing sensor histidine kinase [Burkholderia gladioli]MBW5287276.1 PAS domain S-box protein [Burkholderia gladioli]